MESQGISEKVTSELIKLMSKEVTRSDLNIKIGIERRRDWREGSLWAEELF